MARENTTPTGEYYIFDKATGEKVCPFAEAPATLWGGLLDRATDGDGTILSEAERHQLTYYPELSQAYEVRQRYIDQRGRTAEYRREIGDAAHVGDWAWAGRVGRSATLDDMLRAARKEQERRVRADNEARIRRQAVEHADLYQQALADLDAAEAMGRLRERITSMQDREQRAEWIARYPELFDGNAAEAMAEADRAAEQAELWRTAGGDAIDLTPQTL